MPVFADDGQGQESDSAGTSSRHVTAVLDIDSDRLATFDAEDAKWLELIVSLLNSRGG